MTFHHPLHERLIPYKFILGSTSPRRLEILSKNLNIANINVIPSTYAEDLSKNGLTNEEYVIETCRNKGKHILDMIDHGEPSIILTSDTIISCGGQIFEKPITKERQYQMFEHYKKHLKITVLTAINVLKVSDENVTEFSDIAATYLTFSGSEDLINAYIESGEGLNVAGGFKFQESGCLLFQGIQGDYFNVVGLPTVATFKLLQLAVA